jgi:hypothetical protein
MNDQEFYDKFATAARKAADGLGSSDFVRIEVSPRTAAVMAWHFCDKSWWKSADSKAQQAEPSLWGYIESGDFGTLVPVHSSDNTPENAVIFEVR